MKRILALAVALAFTAPAAAQVSNGKVTTVAPTYMNGNVAPFSLDTSGNLRVVNGGSPSGTQDINIKQIQGSAPSLSNPLWFLPATGAVFPASQSGAWAVGVNAGTNIIGKVGIDQTTPGTTNGVQVNAALPAGTNTIGAVNSVSQYPSGATPITASATGTTSATAATLAAAVSKTTYICGFSIRANATAAATANSTVTGTISGTLNFTQWTAPAASGVGITEMIFTPCVPGSATNTAIVATSAAPGTGGVVSTTAWGYQQ
jgi:hypothetical protein